MKSSDQIGDLLTALHTARRGFKELERNGVNNFFRNKAGKPHLFSTLDDIFNACKDALWENKVEVFYSTTFDGTYNILNTSLVHITSGQWMSSETAIGDSNAKPQEIGSGITYMRRYHIQAMLNLEADFEDDGNVASGNMVTVRDSATPPKQKTTEKFDYAGAPYRVFDSNGVKQSFTEVETWGVSMGKKDIDRTMESNVTEIKRISREISEYTDMTDNAKATLLSRVKKLGA